MAEEVKKTPKPRKPRAPKVSKEALEKFEEEIKKEEPVVEEAPEVEEPEQKVPEEEQKPLDIPETEPRSFDVETLKPVDPVPEEEEPTVVAEEPEVEEETPTELPENTPNFQEFREGSAEVRKLNPNLPDNKSKWVAQISYGNNRKHVIFKGSYARTCLRAKTFNESRGLGSFVRKVN